MQSMLVGAQVNPNAKRVEVCWQTDLNHSDQHALQYKPTQKHVKGFEHRVLERGSTWQQFDYTVKAVRKRFLSLLPPIDMAILELVCAKRLARSRIDGPQAGSSQPKAKHAGNGRIQLQTERSHTQTTLPNRCDERDTVNRAQRSGTMRSDTRSKPLRGA